VTKRIARDPIYRGRRFSAETIELCVRWYITYRLSYRDLAAMMAERGIVLSHTTIMRWVFRYVPEYDVRWARFARSPGSSWRMDETAVNVRGGRYYLYRAVDRQGKSALGLSRATGVPADLKIQILRVNDSPGLFATDPDEADGVPNRGTVIQVDDREYLVCTEGREERQVWRQRTPACIRVVLQDRNVPADQVEQLIEEAFKSSQVNWRAFNASSFPITTTYGGLIARVLSHVPARTVDGLYTSRASAILENRVWFL
jgi:hypothetical protein